MTRIRMRPLLSVLLLGAAASCADHAPPPAGLKEVALGKSSVYCELQIVPEEGCEPMPSGGGAPPTYYEAGGADFDWQGAGDPALSYEGGQNPTSGQNRMTVNTSARRSMGSGSIGLPDVFFWGSRTTNASGGLALVSINSFVYLQTGGTPLSYTKLKYGVNEVIWGDQMQGNCTRDALSVNITTDHVAEWLTSGAQAWQSAYSGCTPPGRTGGVNTVSTSISFECHVEDGEMSLDGGNTWFPVSVNVCETVTYYA